jgi:hypothetical protein
MSAQEPSCSICAAPGACFGYGFPGLRKDLPAKRRGSLWACAAPACRAACEARREAAIAVVLPVHGRAAPKPEPAPPHRSGPGAAQGSLL